MKNGVRDGTTNWALVRYNWMRKNIVTTARIPIHAHCIIQPSPQNHLVLSTDVLADRTIIYDRLLTLSCHLSVCLWRCALWLECRCRGLKVVPLCTYNGAYYSLLRRLKLHYFCYTVLFYFRVSFVVDLQLCHTIRDRRTSTNGSSVMGLCFYEEFCVLISRRDDVLFHPLLDFLFHCFSRLQASCVVASGHHPCSLRFVLARIAPPQAAAVQCAVAAGSQSPVITALMRVQRHLVLTGCITSPRPTFPPFLTRHLFPLSALLLLLTQSYCIRPP